MPHIDETTRRTLVQHLESLQSAGIEQLPRAEPPVSKSPVAKSPVATTVPPAAAAAAADAPSATGTLFALESPRPTSRGTQAATLEILQQQVAACTLCDELAATRTQTVFGTGNPQARLAFLGEAPGADEDRLGEPFVGRGGQLLTKIIEACRLRREDVYILNTLKCRPPGNRNPAPDESNHCRGFLVRQLELVSPEFICCLGAVAAQNLLETSTPIGRLRGKVHDYRGAKVVCTYHPAYLLRNPSAKRDTWEDMKMLMRLMGVEL